MSDDDKSDVPQIRLWGDSTRGHRIHPDVSTKPPWQQPVDLALLRAASPVMPNAPQQRTTEPAQLALRLCTDDGVPLADTMLEVEIDGRWDIAFTDGDGIASLSVPEGSYSLRFPETPLAVPVSLDPCRVQPKVLLERGRTEPFQLSTQAPGQPPADVAIRRPFCTEVLIDGYAQGSTVMRWGGTRERIEPDGAVVVGTCRAALREALWLARGRYALVVGHADPAGSDQANAAVAAARAESVCMYAAGELGAWADHAVANASELDFSCALVAFAKIAGEAIPSLTDHDALVGTRRALHAWSGDATQTAVPNATGTTDEWRAIAEAYDFDLARLLGTDTVGLADLRRTIQWKDAGHGELGERYPRPVAELDTASQLGLPYALACRRTAIVVLGSADADALDDTQEIYDGTFRRTTLEAGAEARVQIRCFDPKGQIMAGARVWIGMGTGVHPRIADAEGMVRFDALRGESIEVVLARDTRGAGTWTNGGLT